MKKFKTSCFAFGLAITMMASCQSGQKAADTTVSGLNPAAFDSTINGKKTALFTLKNSNGMEV